MTVHLPRCAAGGCFRAVIPPRVFCRQCWGLLLDETRAAIAEAWGDEVLFEARCAAALVELELLERRRR